MAAGLAAMQQQMQQQMHAALQPPPPPPPLPKGADRWVVIYPAYIDSNKSESEGRRIPRSFCASDPNLREMAEAVQSLSLNFHIEGHKGYSRDAIARFRVGGRMRVELKNTQGAAILGSVGTSRKKLWKAIGSAIQQQPDRLERERKEKEAAAMAAAGIKGKRR